MRTWLNLSTLLVCGTAWSTAIGCGGGSVGAEGSDCYPNGTCDDGLSCLSNICVDPNQEGNSGSGGDSGTVGGVDLTACLGCGDTACTSEAEACDGSAGCAEVLECYLECADAACQNQCDVSEITQDDVTLVTDYFVCLGTECASECTYVPPDGVGGSGSGSGGTSGSTGGNTSTGESCSTEGEVRGSCVDQPLEACLDGSWTEESCAGCQIVTPSTTCARIFPFTMLDLTEPVGVDNPNMEVVQTESSVTAEWYLEENQMGVLTFMFSSGVDPDRVDLEGDLGKIQLVTIETDSGESGCQYFVDFDGRLTRAATLDWNGCWGSWSTYDLTEPTTGTRVNIRTDTSPTNQDYSLTITKLNI